MRAGNGVINRLTEQTGKEIFLYGFETAFQAFMISNSSRCIAYVFDLIIFHQSDTLTGIENRKMPIIFNIIDCQSISRHPMSLKVSFKMNSEINS